jgi:hypothetical protein
MGNGNIIRMLLPICIELYLIRIVVVVVVRRRLSLWEGIMNGWYMLE